MLAVCFTTCCWPQCTTASQQYRKFFHHCVDYRSIPEKALNLVGLTSSDVGRSFALVAGVSHYSHFRAPNNPYLAPAEADLLNLEQYLKNEEFFDEIVVLKDSDMNYENLKYFLQVYFPEKLKKSPHSRFLFAYSGHGITDGASGYLLESSAVGLDDKNNALDLSVVHALVQNVVRSGYQVLVLLNSCYGGAFLRNSFTVARPIPRKPGAHAITAGGSRERTWADPSLGQGSLFFETLIKGLGGAADLAGDGVITYEEIAAYLKKQIQGFTDQNQNPQSGSLVVDDEHVGSFFFLNRGRMISNGIVSAWNPRQATTFGQAVSQSDAALMPKGKPFARAADVIPNSTGAQLSIPTLLPKDKTSGVELLTEVTPYGKIIYKRFRFPGSPDQANAMLPESSIISTANSGHITFQDSSGKLLGKISCGDFTSDSQRQTADLFWVTLHSGAESFSFYAADYSPALLFYVDQKMKQICTN